MVERDFEAELRSLGCGDTSCLIVASKGMSTNGGCRCFGERSFFAAFKDSGVAHVLGRVLQTRKQQAAAQAAEIVRIKGESEARRTTLFAKAEELRLEWIRAENAEAQRDTIRRALWQVFEGKYHGSHCPGVDACACAERFAKAVLDPANAPGGWDVPWPKEGE